MSTPADLEQRRRAFAALLAAYHHTADDYDEGEEEDPRPYLSGKKPCSRFVCVTDHEGKIFFLPTFNTVGDAQARAVEYMRDDLFAEAPVAVVDLDTGERYHPEPWAMPWAKSAPRTQAT